MLLNLYSAMFRVPFVLKRICAYAFISLPCKIILGVPVTTQNAFKFGFKVSETAVALEILGLKWFQKFCLPFKGEELEEVFFHLAWPQRLLLVLTGLLAWLCLCWVFMAWIGIFQTWSAAKYLMFFLVIAVKIFSYFSCLIQKAASLHDNFLVKESEICQLWCLTCKIPDPETAKLPRKSFLLTYMFGSDLLFSMKLVPKMVLA